MKIEITAEQLAMLKAALKFQLVFNTANIDEKDHEELIELLKQQQK